MDILIVTGSISEKSNNKKIARWFDRQYGGQVNLTHFPLISIPMFNEDIEDDPNTEIDAMRRLFDQADGVVMITPEYNHTIPGVLKNMLDWASRGKRALKDKPVFMLGGSTGRFGTIRAQIHLTQILNSPGVAAKLFARQIQVDLVDQKFTPQGECLDPTTEKHLKRGMDEFLASLTL